MLAILATRSPSTDLECFSVTGDDPTVVEIITALEVDLIVEVCEEVYLDRRW
ncbi:hypothetical protein OIU77_006722 [Salix suchowensis]|uniref:Uncharacterized protein n=1 Tax=Salix suchowensis TaxID=1278906 RepID=A0ABQ9AMM3_9ROSI|nr:hypothetical protein OIU77_006722 [Salix suchowensis]